MTNYEQLDWSPVTWALLLGGMAMAAVICMSLAVVMAYRASQATRPQTTAAQDPTPAAVPAPASGRADLPTAA